MKIVWLRIAFVALYLLVDIAYIVASRTPYESRIKAIQGHGFPKKDMRMLIAGLAYACMAISWWVLVAERLSSTSTIVEALRIAVVFALAVYGVFNATLYVMFSEWNANIFIRDMCWGVTWLSVLTILYVLALRQNAFFSKR